MEKFYSTVTELPGNLASAEQIQRFFNRYHFARQYCIDKDVLEVACGGGQGLGYLALAAKKITAGDLDPVILAIPQDHYQNHPKIKINVFNADQLPFSDTTFDTIILFEAIYYLDDPNLFLKEAHRVLRPDGNLVISLVNKDWRDFNPSPFSRQYFSIPELQNLLRTNRFNNVNFYGDSPVEQGGVAAKLKSLIKRTAVRLNLMPKTMKGKELFKKIFFGRLAPLPFEINETTASFITPAILSGRQNNSQYKIIFIVARK